MFENKSLLVSQLITLPIILDDSDHDKKILRDLISTGKVRGME